VSELGRESLIQARRRRLLVGVAVMAGCSIVVLFSGSLGDLMGVEPWMLKGGGILLFTVVIFVVAHGLKCRRCRTNLLWYGMAHAKNANWLDWLLNQNACPKCGSTDSI
jgi:hypothetical protein